MITMIHYNTKNLQNNTWLFFVSTCMNALCLCLLHKAMTNERDRVEKQQVYLPPYRGRMICYSILFSVRFSLFFSMGQRLRHRDSGCSFYSFSNLVSDLTSCPFTLALKSLWIRWNHHAADSRHVVQECLRGIQECSGECSVLQQQLELRWAARGHLLCQKSVCKWTNQRLCVTGRQIRV